MISACTPRCVSIALLLLLVGLPVFAQEHDFPANGEPAAYEADPSFEQVEPPSIPYEEYAGPDPVLEGTPRPPGRPATAGEQRIADLDLVLDDAGGPAAVTDARRSESGFRAVAEMLMALCIVLGLIVLSFYLIRRFGNRTPLLAGAGLGQVLGRVYLTPKASLHFVRTGGKVLVIGVTQESVQLVETFEATAFEKLTPPPREGEPGDDAATLSAKGSAFLAQLREQSDRMRQPVEKDTVDDGDIATLRGDIERLQRMLREATRD
jgi:flagellar biogenesis protein FliO